MNTLSQLHTSIQHCCVWSANLLYFCILLYHHDFYHSIHITTTHTYIYIHTTYFFQIHPTTYHLYPSQSKFHSSDFNVQPSTSNISRNGPCQFLRSQKQYFDLLLTTMLLLFPFFPSNIQLSIPILYHAAPRHHTTILPSWHL